MSKGIDYSGPGSTANRDPETNIRYGIISLNDLAHWALDDFEADYGEPCCGHCGGDMEEYDDEKHGEYDSTGCCDYACEHCEKAFGSDESYRDEPIGHALDDGEYRCELDSSNDVWVYRSPYYTRAGFCSPCAPGACSLSNPCPDGERAYCFGHDWFEDGHAPYPVYDVGTGGAVVPEGDGFVPVPYRAYGKVRKDGTVEPFGDVDWPALEDDVRDGRVIKVNAGDEWPEDEIRERLEDGCLDYVMEVNDRGNTTLYTPDHKEVWSIV